MMLKKITLTLITASVFSTAFALSDNEKIINLKNQFDTINKSCISKKDNYYKHAVARASALSHLPKEQILPLVSLKCKTHQKTYLIKNTKDNTYACLTQNTLGDGENLTLFNTLANILNTTPCNPEEN